MDVTEQQILDALAREMRCEPVRNDDVHEFEFVVSGRKLSISQEELTHLQEQVARLQIVDSNSVANDTTYEMLVQSGDPRSIPFRLMFGEGNLVVTDEQQGLTYEICRPSSAFAIASLREGHAQELASRMRVINRLISPVRLREIQRDSVRALDVLLGMPYYSLKLTSVKPRPLKSWRKYADAFVFHIGYNLDAALVPRPWQGTPARPTRVRRVGRLDLAELDVPRRIYATDLVHHYQLGISSPSPMLQYISFYHVAEHWLESVYQDDLVEEIQKKLTAPSFSFRRKKDIRDLIKRVSNAVQLRNDELVINEQVALRLTFEKYLDLTDLMTELDEISKYSTQYFASTRVPFSDGDTVPFYSSDASAIFAALSRRIYKTRNAIVHSKDGSRGRFVPYADDSALLPEIPLMRLIAEQIIVATSDDHPL